MHQQQTEHDIYFQGSRSSLFAMLYPLTGPSSPIFDHLAISRIGYSNADRTLEFSYRVRDFSNIDRQDQPVLYSSMSVPTHSNYFYSTFVESKEGGEGAFVWRSVERMMELRPVQVGQGGKQQKDKEKEKEEKSKEKMVNQMEQIPEDSYTELTLIPSDDPTNHIIPQIASAPQTLKLNRNWDISKEEYAARLCE